MVARIKFTGTREIAAGLKRLDHKLQKKAVAPSLRKGLTLIKNDAISGSPYRTGKLRSSIVIRKAKKKFQTKGSQMYSVGVLKKAWYWRFVEFGTSRLSARPFLRPAFERNINKSINLTILTLRKKLGLKRA